MPRGLTSSTQIHVALPAGVEIHVVKNTPEVIKATHNVAVSWNGIELGSKQVCHKSPNNSL
jgi:hypothetical protein